MRKEVEVLRGLNFIDLPSEYTYLNLDTYYQSPDEKRKNIDSQAITNIPLEHYTFDGLVSFETREQRAKRFRSNNSSFYRILPLNSKPISMRIIIPKNTLSTFEKTKLNFNSAYEKELNLIYSGFGDHNEPKLFNTDVTFFASSCYDEISDTYMDILYGVRNCDIEKYYNSVCEDYNNKMINKISDNMMFNRFIRLGTDGNNFIRGSIFDKEYFSSLIKFQDAEDIERMKRR